MQLSKYMRKLAVCLVALIMITPVLGMHTTIYSYGQEYEYAAMDHRQDGVLQANNGNWYYYNGGEINRDYTGLAQNEYGWWYINDGQVDFSYTGVRNNEFGWWYVNQGGVDLSYTGLSKKE